MAIFAKVSELRSFCDFLKSDITFYYMTPDTDWLSRNLIVEKMGHITRYHRLCEV